MSSRVIMVELPVAAGITLCAAPRGAGRNLIRSASSFFAPLDAFLGIMRLRQEAFGKVDSFFQLQNSRLKVVYVRQAGMKVIDVGFERGIGSAATLQPTAECTHDGPQNDDSGSERRNDDEQNDRRPTIIQKNQIRVELRPDRWWRDRLGRGDTLHHH